METLEMKNTVAELQKSDWMSLTAKWEEGRIGKNQSLHDIKITKSEQEKTD